MNTIKDNVTIEYGVKKSIFIVNILKVKNIDDINRNLNKMRKKYNDATHNCYAYIIDNYNKSSDDNEPGGTAGIPILQVLLKNNLTNVLCVVTRYFGGIKLGAGGLVRAYTKACSLAIKESTIVSLVDGFKIKIETDYNNQKNIDVLLKGYQYKKEFSECVVYTCLIDKKVLDKLEIKNIEYKIIEELKIELNE